VTLVDPDYAEWLGREEIIAVSEDAEAASRWGDLALDTRTSSLLAFKPDAAAEAARQLAFRSGVVVIDRLRVQGQHVGMIGRAVTLTARKGGYEGGVDVFVLDADETDPGGGTVFLVLRRLA
jgi:hypothetical protein